MASLFAQPYISPPDYDTVEFPSKKEILLVQQSAVDEYERCQQVFCRPGQCSLTNSYVDNNSSLISE
jgi:hypothetical protein